MEYWKNEIPTTILCDIIQRPSRFSNAQSSQLIGHHSSTPILHQSLKLLQVDPNIFNLAQRTNISKFD